MSARPKIFKMEVTDEGITLDMETGIRRLGHSIYILIPSNLKPHFEKAKKVRVSGIIKILEITEEGGAGAE